MGSMYLRTKWVLLDEYQRGFHYGWELKNSKASGPMVEVQEKVFDTSIDYSNCKFIV